MESDYIKILSLIGEPYSKYDCYQLLLAIGEILNLPYPRLNDYSFEYEVRDSLAKSQKCNVEKIETPYQLGDIVAIRFGPYISHIGVVLDQFSFIHSIKSHGVLKSRLDAIKYASRIEGIYRCKI